MNRGSTKNSYARYTLLNHGGSLFSSIKTTSINSFFFVYVVQVYECSV